MVALQRLELLLILLHALVLGALYSFQVWSACCREVKSWAISACAFCAGDLLLSFALYTRCAAEQASSISILLAYQLIGSICMQSCLFCVSGCCQSLSQDGSHSSVKAFQEQNQLSLCASLTRATFCLGFDTILCVLSSLDKSLCKGLKTGSCSMYVIILIFVHG